MKQLSKIIDSKYFILTPILVGVLPFVFFIPWEMVFNTEVIAGGDNPAHPVFQKSLMDSLLNHFRIIQYDYKFWGGYELFQFYFPLAYILKSVLGMFINPNIAYKIVTILPLCLFPVSMVLMTRILNFSIISSFLAALISIPLLLTEAHVMWGGNIFSLLAGMIGNAWAFMMLPIVYALIIKSNERKKISKLLIFLSVMTSLFHFYGLLMIFTCYLSTFCVDLFRERQKILCWRNLKFYFNGVYTFLLIAWWLIPLAYYMNYTSDFGQDWKVDLLNTFRLEEKILFCLSLVVLLINLVYTRAKSRSIYFMFFFVINVFLFYFGTYTNSTALINIRIWPAIYLSLFFISIDSFNFISKRINIFFAGGIILLFSFILPKETSFQKVKSWMVWNYSGMGAKYGKKELKSLLNTLNYLQPSRISFESDANNNGRFGSVRAFEALPYLTHHEISEGGIVNSASFAGVPYTIQCLQSSSCAGWPAGIIMPEKDIEVGAEYMKMFGVNYHIATKQENIDLFKKSSKYIEVFKEKEIGVFSLLERTPMVEVYEEKLPILSANNFEIPIYLFPKFQSLREKGYILSNDLKLKNTVDKFALFNKLAVEWDSGLGLKDRGWERRRDEKIRYLNKFIILKKGKFESIEKLFGDSFNIQISDRGLDPYLIVPKHKLGYSEIVIPLIRDEAGKSNIKIHARGYTTWVNNLELKDNISTEIEFEKNKTVIVKLIPDGSDIHPYIDANTEDPLIRNGFFNQGKVVFPGLITKQCLPNLEKSFHQLILTTNCPGLPHLIKYNYYPKWNSDVPINLGPMGFMVLTPMNTKTIIQHEDKIIDSLSKIISWITVIFLLFFIPVRRRLRI